MQRAYFITGTDTGVGKTRVSIALMRALQASGRQVCAMKPVASGSVTLDGRQVSGDAEHLSRFASLKLPGALINPVCLEHPASPNIAADMEDVSIDLAAIDEAYRACMRETECLIVEGVGGWRTPVTGRDGMAGLVRLLGLPVIMVVGIRLGCINHALLTEEAILSDGLVLSGWIANCLDPGFDYAGESTGCLKEMLTSPLIGTVPYIEGPDGPSLADNLDLGLLERAGSIVSSG